MLFSLKIVITILTLNVVVLGGGGLGGTALLFSHEGAALMNEISAL